MRATRHTARSSTPAPAAALILALFGAWSCGDGEDLVGSIDSIGGYPGGAPGVPGEDESAGAGGAVDFGGGGEPSHSAGAGGELVEPTGGTGAVPGTGGRGGGAVTGPGSTAPTNPPIIPIYCTHDSDCSDGKYCNGVERCPPHGGDFRTCVRPIKGPCDPHACDEASRSCDCTNPDQDGDSYVVEGCAENPEEVDCDDEDVNRNPGLTEECDLDASEEQRLYDEDCNDANVGPDEDGDTYVNNRCGNIAHEQPISRDGDSRTAPQDLVKIMGTDCDDTRKPDNPAGLEVCDGRDNDCNGRADDVYGNTLEKPARYYYDGDGDFYGNSNVWIESLCLSPQRPYVNEAGDCDDTTNAVGPQATEICNGIDDNCDGKIDLHPRPGTLLVDMPYEDGMTFACGGKAGWIVTSCPAHRLECNNPSHNDACETLATTMCNCHACGAQCNFSCGESSCEEITDVATGLYHTCAIARSSPSAPGGVACWGRNEQGQLGTGTLQGSAVPVAVHNLPRATHIVSGDVHTCAISQGVSYCWGDNGTGQIGVDLAIASSPTPLVVTSLGGAGAAQKLVAGSKHTCAIYDSGVLACWGAGKYGQLGINEAGEGVVMSAPARVRRVVDGVLQYVEDASQVVAGYAHTCSLSTTGIVECWGDNFSGQIGQDPDAVPLSAIPLPIPGLENLVIDEIAASGELSCARAGSEVFCWGSNWYGELTREDIEFSFSPLSIPLPGAARSISVGPTFGCALLANDSLYCWGTNYFGERGSADSTPDIAPTIVPLPSVDRAFAGNGSHVCVTREDGAWCWGRDQYGQLGNGTTSEEMGPVPSRVRALNGSGMCSEP